MTATYSEVAEAVRATIATYTHALDDGRTDDIVATYCADGVFDMPGIGTFEGVDALREGYARFKPRGPQRHLVLNTLVSDWGEHEAQAVSDVVLLVKGESGWAVVFVARYLDTLRNVDGHWLFARRQVVQEGA
ncbi:MAG TPA: nuclear transport factor 2 family protein [Acidimicrobiales bacterium]|nr:nuclear transport factor 2 family protein [Acidimicrobiales bacterium]